jgi:hypothetical protein
MEEEWLCGELGGGVLEWEKRRETVVRMSYMIICERRINFKKLRNQKSKMKAG